MTRTIRNLAAAAALAMVVSVPALVTLTAQASGQNGLPDLITALKATPGVLGVDAARGTLNGKMVIFTWFQNRDALMAWYKSDMHQSLVLQFGGGRQRPSEPLAGVPDDGRPILAIASMTMRPGASGDIRSSVTQMAIELYAPLPGGLAAGGRFAPSTATVPGLIEVAITGAPSADAR